MRVRVRVRVRIRIGIGIRIRIRIRVQVCHDGPRTWLPPSDGVRFIVSERDGQGCNRRWADDDGTLSPDGLVDARGCAARTGQSFRIGNDKNTNTSMPVPSLIPTLSTSTFAQVRAPALSTGIIISPDSTRLGSSSIEVELVMNIHSYSQ